VTPVKKVWTQRQNLLKLQQKQNPQNLLNGRKQFPKSSHWLACAPACTKETIDFCRTSQLFYLVQIIASQQHHLPAAMRRLQRFGRLVAAAAMTGRSS
jgi:hypothetical protein